MSRTTKPSGWAALATLAPGLVVALGAAAATAHGLFEVVLASKVPAEIAWIYPVITDGLAIVAYAATSRLPKQGRRYAWGVVILAAGLSGVAQAVYLAGGVAGSGGRAELPAAMRFGVGAWPAVAAAIVAHLVFMLAAEQRTDTVDTDHVGGPGTDVMTAESLTSSTLVVQSAPVQPSGVQSDAVQSPRVQPVVLDGVAPSSVDGRTAGQTEDVQPEPSTEPAETAEKPGRSTAVPSSPKRDRARAAARKHQALHGNLPTVDELMKLAEVSRGTAGTALQELREQPAHLHVITELSTTKANT